MTTTRKKSYPTYKSVNLGGKVTVIDMKMRAKINAPQLLDTFLATHCRIGDNLSIRVEARRPMRTEDQNNFYHLYLSLIEKSSGNSMKELKCWVCENILGKGITEVFGEETRIVGSSADCNINEFTEMMNQIEERTKIPIPNPEQFNVPLTLDEYGKLKRAQNAKYGDMEASDELKKDIKKSNKKKKKKEKKYTAD